MFLPTYVPVFLVFPFLLAFPSISYSKSFSAPIRATHYAHLMFIIYQSRTETAEIIKWWFRRSFFLRKVINIWIDNKGSTQAVPIADSHRPELPIACRNLPDGHDTPYAIEYCLPDFWTTAKSGCLPSCRRIPRIAASKYLHAAMC
jgi:hypothetical protein